MQAATTGIGQLSAQAHLAFKLACNRISCINNLNIWPDDFLNRRHHKRVMGAAENHAVRPLIQKRLQVFLQ